MTRIFRKPFFETDAAHYRRFFVGSQRVWNVATIPTADNIVMLPVRRERLSGKEDFSMVLSGEPSVYTTVSRI